MKKGKAFGEISNAINLQNYDEKSQICQILHLKLSYSPQHKHNENHTLP